MNEHRESDGVIPLTEKQSTQDSAAAESTLLPGKLPQQPTPADDLTVLWPPQAPGELARIGSFRLLSKLGEGGMGQVYLAEDLVLGRRVALKVMKPTLAAVPSARARFLREARAAAGVEHEHVVKIHQAGEDNGVAYLVMELLSGESLEEHLKRCGKLSIKDAVRLGRQMALGLAAAHAHGLVHRDIKPANVWLEAHGSQPVGLQRVKILDFGLAHAADGDGHLTAPGAVLGTPAYMSPEQAEGMDVDARADLFSLGAVLYRMLTGTPAFQGNSGRQILWSVLCDQPLPPSQVNPDVPLRLSELVMHLLAKDRADRPASAAAVIASFDDISAANSPTSGPGGQSAETILDRLHRKLLLANSPWELLRLVYEVESYLAKDPHSVEGRLLKDKTEIALKKQLKGSSIYACNVDRVRTPRSMAAPAQRATPRGKWRWAAAAAVAGSAIVAAIFLWPWGGAENDKGVQQAPPPKAIAMRLDLRVWRKGDLTRVLKLADPGTLPLRPGDRVSVEASADRPVYFYVLYLEAKGAVAPMYPWRNYDWNDRPTEQKRGQLFVPDDPDKNAAPLTSGPSGIESYLLLARDEPLSPEDNERLADCFTNLIKQNAPDLRGAVWLTRAGREFSQEADRGRPDQAQAVAPTDPLEQVRRLLAGPLATLADDARAVCFSFKGD